MSTPIFASHVGPDIERYLALKHALGRRCRIDGNVLAHLDRFLVKHGAELTVESFTLWCVSIAHLSPTVRRNWMRITRNLCLYRQRTVPACFVPDTSDFPSPHEPRRPHLFTEQEITRLLRATDDLRPCSTSPLHREVYRLAVVLLYTTGLRRGELVSLALGDYDPAERTLMVRASKFHKSRIVPLSTDAKREMDVYLVARRRFPHAAEGPILFNRHFGIRPYTGEGLAQGLQQLFRSADIQSSTGQRPRVHDMRHTFAHEALRRWYRAGLDVQAKLPALAAYLGHVSVLSTQYYLSFFEPFAEAASARFARHFDPFLETMSGGGEP